jgi:hypothetical protein
MTGQVYLDALLADAVEHHVLGAIGHVLDRVGADDLTWADFDVRDFAEDIAARIMEHVENRPVSLDDAKRLAD